mgnify:CR=1 FL=1
MNKKLNLKQGAVKLALGSAFALGGFGVCLHAYAATASSTATSIVMVPIAVTAGTVLDFGKFSAGASGGTIKVEPDSTVAVTSTVLRGTGATSTAAQFTVTGDASNTYSIAYTGDATLANGINTMALTKVSALTAPTSTALVATGTLTLGTQTIFVGGTLTVGASQVAGTYTGAVGVTVLYN